MSNAEPPSRRAFPFCAGLKAHDIDVETHGHVLAVLVDAVSRLEGGSAALAAARKDLERAEAPLVAFPKEELSLLMTAEFLDAWRVGKD